MNEILQDTFMDQQKLRDSVRDFSFSCCKQNALVQARITASAFPAALAMCPSEGEVTSSLKPALLLAKKECREHSNLHKVTS